ncbi:MAG TPA: glycine/betaine ABC transporter permease, partial [Paracoccaceae bacterium]|nr:glycine/betaine ABC transporter permease [Paracoccaceae bacterium]
MATYDGIFDALGLRGWCDAAEQGGGGGAMSMADLLNKGGDDTTFWQTPFPSLDTLNKACAAMPRTRDLTKGVEEGFLAIKDAL